MTKKNRGGGAARGGGARAQADASQDSAGQAQPVVEEVAGAAEPESGAQEPAGDACSGGGGGDASASEQPPTEKLRELDVSEATACAKAIERGESGRGALGDALDSDARVLASVAVTEVRAGRETKPRTMGMPSGALEVMGLLGVRKPDEEWGMRYRLALSEELVRTVDEGADRRRREAEAIGARVEEARRDLDAARVDAERRIAATKRRQLAAELGIEDAGSLEELVAHFERERTEAGDLYRSIKRECDEERRALDEREARAKSVWETSKQRVVTISDRVRKARAEARELAEMGARTAVGDVGDEAAA